MNIIEDQDHLGRLEHIYDALETISLELKVEARLAKDLDAKKQFLRLHRDLREELDKLEAVICDARDDFAQYEKDFELAMERLEDVKILDDPNDNQEVS